VGTTQRQLADKVNVDFSYLSKIENGVVPPPSENVISKLAGVLNIDKDELMILAGRIPCDIAQMLRNRQILEFGARLRKLRIQAGMTQSGLASKVNIDSTYLSKMESGVKSPPSQKVVLRLAEVLNVGKDELLTLAGKIPPDIAGLLKNREALQFLRSERTEKKARASTKKGLSLTIHKAIVRQIISFCRKR